AVDFFLISGFVMMGWWLLRSMNHLPPFPLTVLSCWGVAGLLYWLVSQPISEKNNIVKVSPRWTLFVLCMIAYPLLHLGSLSDLMVVIPFTVLLHLALSRSVSRWQIGRSAFLGAFICYISLLRQVVTPFEIELFNKGLNHHDNNFHYAIVELYKSY